jgi:hypothetical protein
MSEGAWILEPSATWLCKPGLHVFAKLFEDCLKWGHEAATWNAEQALSAARRASIHLPDLAT